MAFANSMTRLLNKIERRLATRTLNLPPELQKDKWGEIIKEDTIVTFSRFYPHRMKYFLTDDNRGRDGYYYLDEDMFDGDVEIIGIKDIAFDQMMSDTTGALNPAPYGVYDAIVASYDIEGFIGAKMRQDMSSMYNTGVFVRFEKPNRISITNSTGNNMVTSIGHYPIYVFVTHAPNLSTIEPTKMETFENLAQADIATWLYGELKMYDNLETVFAGNVDLKLDEIKQWADRRDDLVQFMKENYISADNFNQPSILCI